MKDSFRFKYFLIIISIIFSFHIIAYGEENGATTPAKTTDQTNKKNQTQAEIFTYIPPATKKLRPEIRIAKGGVRGDSDCSTLPTITLLVPNHVGYTAHSQPDLFFHSTDQLNNSVLLTIQDQEAEKPTLSVKLKEKVIKGINTINLSDYSFSFIENKEYQWSLEIAGSDKKSLCESIARSLIKMKTFQANIRNKTKKLNGLALSNIYAENGYWYDALERFLTSDLDIQTKRETLSSILNQVDLNLNY